MLSACFIAGLPGKAISWLVVPLLNLTQMPGGAIEHHLSRKPAFNSHSPIAENNPTQIPVIQRLIRIHEGLEVNLSRLAVDHCRGLCGWSKAKLVILIRIIRGFVERHAAILGHPTGTDKGYRVIAWH